MARFQIRQTRMKRKLGKLMKEALPPNDVDLPRVVLGSRPLADISVKDRLVADEALAFGWDGSQLRCQVLRSIAGVFVDGVPASGSFEVPAGSELPRPGDVVSVTITQAAPFHLLADSPDDAPLRIRRTRAGDAWDRAQSESCGVPATTGAGASVAGRVSLGLPVLRAHGTEPLVAPGVGTMPIYDPTDAQR